MPWNVLFHEEFEVEFEQLGHEVQDEAFANLKVLERFGPQLGRPRVDTLYGSRYSNMKELRFGAADGVWRFAFGFDRKDGRFFCVAADKSGGSESRSTACRLPKLTRGMVHIY